MVKVQNKLIVTKKKHGVRQASKKLERQASFHLGDDLSEPFGSIDDRLKKFRSRVRPDENVDQNMIYKPRQTSHALNNPLKIRELSDEKLLMYYRKKIEENFEQEVEIRQHPIKGRCVFAKTHIEAGDMIAEYKGEILDKIEHDKRLPTYIAEEKSYIFNFEGPGGRIYIDASNEREEWGYARLVAHSRKQPNVRWVVLKDARSNYRVIFAAKKDITPGDEIMVDYGAHGKSIEEEFPWLRE